MNFLQGNISARFKVIYGIFFLLIISSTVWLSYLSSKGSLEDQVRSTNVALLNLIQQKIEMMLREIDTNTINFIQEPDVSFFLHGRYANDDLRFNHFRVLNDRFKALMFANSNISSFYLYSLENKSLLTDTTFSDEADFYDMNWRDAFTSMTSYQKWLDTRKITEISSGLHLDKNVITLVRSYPLISIPQFRKGAIIVNVAENTVSNLIQNVDKQRAGQTLVINERGMIISSQDKKQLFQPVSSIEGAPRLEQLTDSGYLTQNTDNGSYTTFYLTSAYNGWKYVSIIPNPEMNRPLQIIRNLLLTIAVGMFLLAIVLVFAVSNYTFRPLELFFRSITEKKIGRPGDLTYMEKFFKQIISDNETLQKQMNESLPALKWRSIMSLMMGDKTNYSRMKPYFDMLGISLYDVRFVVLVIELDRIQDIATPRDVYLFTYAISNVAEELVAGVCKGVSVELTDGRVAVIMSFEEDDSQGNQIQALQVADLVKDYVEGHFKQTVTIGVGRPQLHLEGIHSSYQEALNALKYKLIMGDNSVVSIDDIAGNNHNDKFYRISGMSDSVVNYIRDTDKVKLEAQLDKIFGEIIASNVPPEMIKQMCIQLIMKSIKVISDKGLEIKEFLDPKENIYNRIESCANVDDIKSYISTFLHQLIVRTEEKRLSRGNNDTIKQVMEYMEQHYMDSDLSLNLLASQFQLSVPYLSKLFKETTETNFMDCLIQFRMEKSKELLLDPKRKVNAIAESVGYNSTQSFIRIFKKYTGQTPGEFRENHNKAPRG
ncbi:helix-turn-helix domain-containing protein [Paenibacillus radicis (ex Xue et al. 2023)]|uniref:Helix-turn-helix domain-containing protein n=2 Tax=Paenibacillus TaxID=44249 RepID=A0ABT1YIV6_9BACL|nr:helix-turn-helix domain-containing protein [Paenibacillus radicis (ex Xue et al. 2023)]MCR8633106.1 helix-turn-helix domain-containing protein [Paenibacillus radicis (ex Xue et al. 2023)]